MRLFRRVAPDLLAKYFDTHNVLSDFPWKQKGLVKPKFVKALKEAYQKVPPNKREEIDEECNQIHDLCNLPAQETLQYIADKFGISWNSEMMPEERTLLVFMENKGAFETACNWCQIENYSSYNVYNGKQANTPKEWTKIEQPLTDAWKLLLQNENKEYGRVYIEPYESEDRFVYWIFYEAPKQYITRFDDKTNKPDDMPDKPVSESLMIYYHRLGKLKVKADRNSIAEAARDNYARLALDDENFFNNPDNKRIYDLTLFKKKLEPEDFPTGPKDDIASVRVVNLRFKPDAITRDIIEINSVKDLKGRIKLLEIDLPNIVITRVKMQVIFKGRGAGIKKSFSLSSQNKNTLKDSKKDRLIEQYLVKWDIANR